MNKIASNIGLAAVAAIVGVLVVAAFRYAQPNGTAAVLPPPATTATPTQTATVQPTAAFLGDSYTQGAGASTHAARWTTILANREGWREVNYGQGSTGYATDGTLGGRAYPDRVAAIVAEQPDIVIVSGGRNDIGRSQTSIEAGIGDTLTKLRDGLPNTTIYVLSPLWDDDAAPAALSRIDRLVRAESAKAHVTYVKVGQPLAGHPEYVAGDGVHPNDAGYAAIANAVAKALG